MLDVVPPDPSSKRIRRSTPAQRPSVVELDWRLPARLRRPVREELRRQRRLRRQREAIVSFKRRPIYAEPPAPPVTYQAPAAPVRPAPAVRNSGAEHHTGDVYRHGRPAMRALLPPYAGSFMRSAAAPPKRRLVARRSTPAQAPMPRERTPAPGRSPVRPGIQAPARRVRSRSAIGQSRSVQPSAPERKLAVTGERDVPFTWQSYTPAVTPEEAREEVAMVQMSDREVASGITEPRRRFALPLHFSIWPRGWRSASSDNTSGKKKL